MSEVEEKKGAGGGSPKPPPARTETVKGVQHNTGPSGVGGGAPELDDNVVRLGDAVVRLLRKL